MISFQEKKLPEYIFKNINRELLMSDETHLDNVIKDAWTKEFPEVSIDPDFSFIHAVRLSRGEKKKEFIKIFIIKEPTQDDNVNIISAISIKNNNSLRYFGFKKLDEKLLPKLFIKKNQVNLLFEINKDIAFKNWGALINCQNLNEITNSILLIVGDK